MRKLAINIQKVLKSHFPKFTCMINSVQYSPLKSEVKRIKLFEKQNTAS